MANPPKPWKAEYAKSSRSSCKTCKTNIEKEVFRLGKMVPATQFDGFMPMWNHGACILKKANQIKSVDDVEGIDLLRWEDQQKIRKYVEGGSISTAPVAANECAIEVSQTSRASCRRCNQKIMKGDVRVATKPDGQGSKGLAWHHAGCFMEMCPSTEVEKLSGWDGLNSQDKEAVQALTKKGVPAAKTVSKVESNDNKELAQQSASKGTKRKKALDDQQKTKIPKAEGSMRATSQNGSESENRKSGATDVEKLLEEQTKSLWTIKDDLKKHVTTAEMREMLEANGQDATGSEFDLRDRCADGMLFGALESCPICSGSLRYSGGKYHCLGYASAWSKCSFSTAEPVRCKEKWKIPDETNNQYLTKWFKSQKGKKPNRILPPPSSSKSTGSEVAPGSCQPSKSERLEDLKVAFFGLRKESLEEWRNKIEGAGGMVHPKTKKETNCLVVSGELDDNEPEVRKAR